MFKGAKLSPDLSVTKSYLSVEYFDSKCNAHSFLRPKTSSNFGADAGLLFTART